MGTARPVVSVLVTLVKAVALTEGVSDKYPNIIVFPLFPKIMAASPFSKVAATTPLPMGESPKENVIIHPGFERVKQPPVMSLFNEL